MKSKDCIYTFILLVIISVFFILSSSPSYGVEEVLNISGEPADASFIKEQIKKYLSDKRVDPVIIDSISDSAHIPPVLRVGESFYIDVNPDAFAGKKAGNSIKTADTPDKATIDNNSDKNSNTDSDFRLNPFRLVIKNIFIPNLHADFVALSNSPEKIKKPGLLFNVGLLKYKPVRLRVYHLGEENSPPHYVGIFITNRQNKPARVHFVSATGGPDKNWMFAGHMNNMKFMHRKEKNLGRVYDIPGNSSVPLEMIYLSPGEVISGTYDLLLTRGDPVQIQVFALDKRDDHLNFYIASDKEDTHSRGAYPVTHVDTRGSFTIGDSPTFYTVADTPIQDIFQGKANRGNYGVIYDYELTLKNPYSEKKAVNFFFQPRGGHATATFSFNGETVSVGTTQAYQLVHLCRLWVDAHSEKTVLIKTMPEDASNYPVRMILIGE